MPTVTMVSAIDKLLQDRYLPAIRSRIHDLVDGIQQEAVEKFRKALQAELLNIGQDVQILLERSVDGNKFQVNVIIPELKNNAT